MREEQPRPFINCVKRPSSDKAPATHSEDDEMFIHPHMREHGSMESLETTHSLKPEVIYNSNHHFPNSAAAYSPRTGYSNGPPTIPTQFGTPGHAGMMASNHRIQLPTAFYSDGFPHPAFPQSVPADLDCVIPPQGSRLTLDSRADVICLVLHKVTISQSPMNKHGFCVQVVPCVQDGDYPASLGEAMVVGRNHTGNNYEAHINSGLLRFNYNDRRLLTLKVFESFEGKLDLIGTVRLSNLPRNVLSEDLVPDLVINRPEFCKCFPIENLRTGGICGHLYAGVLFDYRRPNEFPWPHPNYAEPPLRQRSEPWREQQQTGSSRRGGKQHGRRRGSLQPAGRQQEEEASWFSNTLRTFCLQLPDALC